LPPSTSPLLPPQHQVHSTSLTSFSLITPRPPTSTLFPYTTLFRSKTHITKPSIMKKAHNRWRHFYLGRVDVKSRKIFFHFTRREDRKSTRLNSSHVSISYAVFCLKKKKKQTTTTDILVKSDMMDAV